MRSIERWTVRGVYYTFSNQSIVLLPVRAVSFNSYFINSFLFGF